VKPGEKRLFGDAGVGGDLAQADLLVGSRAEVLPGPGEQPFAGRGSGIGSR
jgi:hypothetical protein